MNQEETWLLKEKYSGEKTAGFFADCQRLAAGEPLAYLIGHTPFLNCSICLDSHPLIPRPETEFWVEKAISDIRMVLEQALRKPSPKRLSREPDSCLNQNHSDSNSLAILDLCAGSGCIGVAIKKALPAVRVDFSEIDPRHLPTIQKNLQQNIPNPVDCQLFESDLFAGIPTENRYNVIVSNPPYIDPALDRTESSVKDHEPHLALYGGAAGMEVIEKIIEQASVRLTHRGQLWLEHEPEQSSNISSFATKHGFTATTHKDQFGVERYSVLVLQ